MRSSFPSPSIDFSDTASQKSSAQDTMTTTSSRSEPPRSPISDVRKKKKAQDHQSQFMQLYAGAAARLFVVLENSYDYYTDTTPVSSGF